MSSDESVVEEILTADENDELSLQSSRKKVEKESKLSWRSEELQTIISSLDRKRSRKRNPRAKAMVLETEIGETYSREACTTGLS